MVMSRRSVHITTLFHGQINQYSVHILLLIVTDNTPFWISRSKRMTENSWKSMAPGQDRTRVPWICSGTRYQLRNGALSLCLCGLCVWSSCFVMQYLMFFFFSFCNHLTEEERAGCITLNVFLPSCSYYCFVSLPHGALGWSVTVTISFTLCPLGNFSCFFVVCWLFSKSTFPKILSGIPSECQTAWIQIRADILSGRIWVQSVCKGYQ